MHVLKWKKRQKRRLFQESGGAQCRGKVVQPRPRRVQVPLPPPGPFHKGQPPDSLHQGWASSRIPAQLGLPNLSCAAREANRIIPSAAPQSLGAYRRQQMQYHRFPKQLSLPLDCFVSAPGGPPQSLARSKRPRSRLLQARLEASLAMLAQLDTVPGSFPESTDLDHFRQGHRFSLTPSLSLLINEVNGKRWSHVAALPPLSKGTDAKSGESRAPF